MTQAARANSSPSSSRDAIAAAKARHDASPLRVESEKRAGILDLELQAAIQSADNHRDQAVALLRRATALEDKLAYAFGPPMVDKPSHELLGEELLALHRGPEARTEFQRALKTMPRRPLALRGLALADEASGDAHGASATWRDLASIWHLADPTWPGLEVARQKAH